MKLQMILKIRKNIAHLIEESASWKERILIKIRREGGNLENFLMEYRKLVWV